MSRRRLATFPLCCALAGCHLLLPFPERPADRGAKDWRAPDARTDVASDGPFGQGEWRLDAPEHLSALSSANWDGDPFVSADGLTIYFSTFRDANSLGLQSEIYRAARPSKQQSFGAPARMLELSSSSDETLSMTNDGLTAFLVTGRPGGKGLSDIWKAERAAPSVPWSNDLFFPSVGTAAQEWDARPSADGLRLYFSSEGYVANKQVIMVVARPDRASPFGSSYSPLAGIDDSYQSNSADATLSPDQRVLVFCSDRPGGTGLTDLWYAVREGNTERFSTPQPLPQINSAQRDQDPFISADGTELYFSSDRPPALELGDNEIFRVVIHKAP
jgi:Tol biopolymer transport system component